MDVSGNIFRMNGINKVPEIPEGVVIATILPQGMIPGKVQLECYDFTKEQLMVSVAPLIWERGDKRIFAMNFALRGVVRKVAKEINTIELYKLDKAVQRWAT